MYRAWICAVSKVAFCGWTVNLTADFRRRLEMMKWRCSPSRALWWRRSGELLVQMTLVALPGQEAAAWERSDSGKREVQMEFPLWAMDG